MLAGAPKFLYSIRFDVIAKASIVTSGPAIYAEFQLNWGAAERIRRDADASDPSGGISLPDAMSKHG